MLPRLRMVPEERADLHVHSHFSDGLHSPARLVEMAAAQGLGCLGLTDHASLAGVVEAAVAGAAVGVHVVPGVELNAEDGDLLGYWVDPEHAPLREHLALLQRLRAERLRRINERLARHGVILSWDRLLALAHPAPPARPHLARLLVEEGASASVDEAFQRWLGPRGAAWEPGVAPTLAACAQVVRDAGGVAVAAHPLFHLARLPEDPDAHCARLSACGVVGIELLPAPEPALEPLATALAAAAARHGLLALSGSNFHGAGLTRATLGQHTVGGERLAALQAALPEHSLYRDALKRNAWRAANLSPAELAGSFQPQTVHIDALHREDLLALASPEPRPAVYPPARPFVLLGPGALEHEAHIRALMTASGLARIAPRDGDDYPRIAWHLYEMFGGLRPRDPRDLLRYELDLHLFGERARCCRVLWFDTPPQLDFPAFKRSLRAAVGSMRFYRLICGPLKDSTFTSWLHIPDRPDVPREAWHLARLGIADPLGPP
ncbi:MAG: PHP domain-containing protein [Pseudomonadota bacterium]